MYQPMSQEEKPGQDFPNYYNKKMQDNQMLPKAK